MLGAFAAAVAQLSDPRLVRLVVRCVGMTALVYALLLAGLWWLLATTTVGQWPWLDTLFDLGTGFAAVVIAWIMFPGIASAVLALMLDDVVAIVEDRHYPHLPAPRPLSRADQFGAAARLLLATVGLNLVLLPLYVVLVFLPPANLLFFYAVNGHLLGREYFETVALRRLDTTAMTALRRRESVAIWGAGIATTVLLGIPILNLAAPVIGMAAMVHLFQKLTAKPLDLPPD